MFVHRLVHHYLPFKALAINTQGSSQRPTESEFPQSYDIIHLFIT